MFRFKDELDEKTLKAGDKFISDIKEGKYYKRTLANTAEDFPLDEAAKSFIHFITTEESKNISKMD